MLAWFAGGSVSGRLLRSTMTVGAMTMLSRVLGLLRDIVIAGVVGAGAGADAFFVAFKIPNFMRRLFAEGAFSQSFVPVLSDYREKHDRVSLRALVAAVAGVHGGILLLVTIMGVLAAPLLIMVFAPGFIASDGRYDLAVEMIRITFPYLFFISLTAMAAGILNSFGQFAVPAFTPVLLNLTLISATLWFAPALDQPVMALAWGVLLAGLLQFLFQLYPLFRLGLLVWPRWQPRQAGVRRIGSLMLPAILGSSVAQINLLLDTLIASFLVTGSVSWLYFSDRLMEFPLGVFGIALATVVLPSLSRSHASGASEGYMETIDWALRLVFLVTFPAALGLFLLAGPMLTTLFEYGQFAATDVAMSRLSLMAYALGLPGFVLVKVLASAFYARQDTRTPVRIAVISMVANMVANIAIVIPMVVYDIPGPHAGLALATTISAYLNAWLLYRALCRQGYFSPQPGWGLWLARIFPALLLMTLLLLWLSPAWEVWHVMPLLERVGRLMFWVLSGLLLCLLVFFSLGLRWRHLRGPSLAASDEPL